ncbi:MAG: class I SAM-dependent methyltransferase [Gemmatimonadetes bacterium]|nr:class I SAM-dependent methyltransferase [Gemmatimonadota bacterium]
MTAPTGGSPEGVRYLLGHTDDELRRLDIQGELFRAPTLRAFEDAGIAPGMRVLDIGSGSGDVSLLVAELVGAGGTVVGIDRGEEAVRAARERAQARGLTQVEFRVSEVDEFTADEPFDALVGRFVLMHQSRPGRALARAAAQVRPGGIVCLIESYMDALLTGAHSFPHSPLYDEIVRWKSEVVGGAGADLHAGVRLPLTFAEAGLPNPHTRLESRLEGGPDSVYYRYVGLSLASMQPEARRQGLGGLVNADPDVVADRLRAEVMESGGTLVVWPVVAAWCRTPMRATSV